MIQVERFKMKIIDIVKLISDSTSHQSKSCYRLSTVVVSEDEDCGAICFETATSGC